MNSVKPTVLVRNLGLMCYRKAFQIQEETLNSLAAAIKSENTNEKERFNTLLIVEHKPVYTVGIRSKLYSKEEEFRLQALGADFVRTNRGGLITFHGPGQLVAYPILYLGDFNSNRSIRWYVEQLEKAVIKLCKTFEIQATRSPYTGVWVKDDKLAAIGIHSKQYITSHGLAINCNIDLGWFSHIVPCGIPDKGVTSFSKLLRRDVPNEEVLPAFLDAFQEAFPCHMITHTEQEKNLMQRDS